MRGGHSSDRSGMAVPLMNTTQVLPALSPQGSPLLTQPGPGSPRPPCYPASNTLSTLLLYEQLMCQPYPRTRVLEIALVSLSPALSLQPLPAS